MKARKCGIAVLIKKNRSETNNGRRIGFESLGVKNLT